MSDDATGNSMRAKESSRLTRHEAAVYAALAFYGVVRKIEFDEEKRRLLLVNFIYEFLDEVDDGNAEDAKRRLAEIYVEKIFEEFEAA
jgi:hypothetical protein